VFANCNCLKQYLSCPWAFHILILFSIAGNGKCFFSPGVLKKLLLILAAARLTSRIQYRNIIWCMLSYIPIHGISNFDNNHQTAMILVIFYMYFKHLCSFIYNFVTFFKCQECNWQQVNVSLVDADATKEMIETEGGRANSVLLVRFGPHSLQLHTAKMM